MDACIFCKIVKGELPSFKIYEDADTLAFLDIHPVNAGHTLVIPKNHSTNVFDIPKADWTRVMEAVRMLSGTIEKSMNADGINLAINNREHAGQIVDHAHVHIMPRFKGDGFKLWAHKTYKDGEAKSAQEKILAGLN